jgi:hypothetical protein
MDMDFEALVPERLDQGSIFGKHDRHAMAGSLEGGGGLEEDFARSIQIRRTMQHQDGSHVRVAVLF